MWFLGNGKKDEDNGIIDRNKNGVVWWVYE